MSLSTAFESSVGPLGKRTAPFEPVRQRAKRRKGLNAMSDAEVWDHPDKEVLDAVSETWRSSVYAHYTLALERHLDDSGAPLRLVIRFDCKFHSPDHVSQRRERLRSSDGTQNLIIAAKACDRRRGVTLSQPHPATSSELATYSKAIHRAILAIRCARDHRSFESVVDELHHQEVELLRPGTELPSSASVSTDVKRIYEEASGLAGLYLQQVPGALHLAVDGWTSPTLESYLGVIVFWREKSKIWRTILEFIRLTKAHKGDYMARRIHDCLKRFGIENKIASVCLDNASPNNTLVTQLQSLIPNFRGTQSRIRCFPHVVNLMAKSFLSLFSPPTRPAKDAPAEQNPPSEASSDDPAEEPEESTKELDSDKAEHDEAEVNSMTADARRTMAAAGLVVSDEEITSARKIMFKVAGLARRVNDSPTLDSLFLELVAKDPELEGNSKALTRRVATRWNTDRACLDSHLYFKGPVQWMTGNTKLKLKKYALDDDQWALAAELSSVLAIFQEPTDRFSQAKVPLIHETLPELLTLRARLLDVRDDVLGRNLRPITRIAAEAALRVFDKYSIGLNLSQRLALGGNWPVT